jgi:O-antigen/teichoic acid export membrane protein
MSQQTRLLTVLLGAAVGLGFVTDVAFGLFQATSQFRFPLAITAVYKVATLGCAVAIVSRGGHVLDVASVVVALQVGQLLLALILIWRRITPIDWWPEPRSWSQLAAESSPLAIASLADTISNRADIVILGLLRPVRDVGIYGAAYNLYIGATVVGAAVQVALLPAFARSSEGAFPNLWRHSAIAVCAAGLGIGLLFLSFADGIVLLVYGPTLAAAAQPLRILGPAALLYVTERLLITTLISRGWQRAVLFATIPGAVANVVLNFAIVPSFGYNGAATATFGSELVVLLVAALLLSRRVPSLRARHAPL